MAANRPDRDLRFILGHAFTLDKVMLRVVEIEQEASPNFFEVADDESDWATRPTCGGPGGRRVSFQNLANKPMGMRKSSPPPVRSDNVSSSEEEDNEEESDEDDIAEDDENSGDELSLQRFGSASARPPRLVDDESDSDEEETNEPVSPTESELRSITNGPQNEDLAETYQKLKNCGCHGHDQDAPGVEKVWELPRKAGEKRIAVVQFAEGSEV